MSIRDYEPVYRTLNRSNVQSQTTTNFQQGRPIIHETLHHHQYIVPNMQSIQPTIFYVPPTILNTTPPVLQTNINPRQVFNPFSAYNINLENNNNDQIIQMMKDDFENDNSFFEQEIEALQYIQRNAQNITIKTKDDIPQYSQDSYVRSSHYSYDNYPRDEPFNRTKYEPRMKNTVQTPNLPYRSEEKYLNQVPIREQYKQPLFREEQKQRAQIQNQNTSFIEQPPFQRSRNRIDKVPFRQQSEKLHTPIKRSQISSDTQIPKASDYINNRINMSRMERSPLGVYDYTPIKRSHIEIERTPLKRFPLNDERSRFSPTKNYSRLNRNVNQNIREINISNMN